MTESLPAISTARYIQRQLVGQTVRFVAGKFCNSAIRNTRHFREWFHIPMNYVRMMELPLTALLLQAQAHEAILDVSSPKLLALYYALQGYDGVVAADVEDYFVADFEAYRKHANIAIDVATFDAADCIPYADGHFDKVFSVSVLEHIPYDGDTRAVREMLRVLKESGCGVLTLPAFPSYIEEWLSWSPPWPSVRNAQGKSFFQRRYDREALLNRLLVPGATIEQIVLIAEKPAKPPHLADDGMLLHNAYYIDHVPLARLIDAIGRRLRFLPFMPYLAQRYVSRKCHYLTSDWADPNIRQVVIKITKNTSSGQVHAGAA